MSNLFLPPFPQEGLTQDYVDTINSIFSTIASHTHVPVTSGGVITYPAGNQIQTDSVNFSDEFYIHSLQNCLSFGFVNSVIIPLDNTLFVSDTFTDLYFKKVGVSTPIQITDNLYINASALINGIIGPFEAYGISLFFDNIANTYTFTGISTPPITITPINVYTDIFTINVLNSNSITCNNLSLTNAPNFPVPAVGFGFIYFNQNDQLIYSSQPINLNKTTLAKALIFDNEVEYSLPPIGFGTNYPGISTITNYLTVIQYFNGSQDAPSPVTLNFFVSDAAWFNGFTDDILIAGNVKSTFYCEPFSNNNISLWANPEYYSLQTETERWVWNLTNQQVYSLYTQILHYTFNLYSITPDVNMTPLPVTSWNDCLIENKTAGGVIEKFILIDIGGTIGVNFAMKFHYLYNMGVTAV